MSEIYEFDRWFKDAGHEFTDAPYPTYRAMSQAWQAGQRDLLKTMETIRDDARKALISDAPNWRVIRELALIKIEDISKKAICRAKGE